MYPTRCQRTLRNRVTPDSLPNNVRMLRVGVTGAPRMPTRDSGRTSLSETQRFELSERTPCTSSPPGIKPVASRYLAAAIIGHRGDPDASPPHGRRSRRFLSPPTPWTASHARHHHQPLRLLAHRPRRRRRQHRTPPASPTSASTRATSSTSTKNASRSAAPLRGNLDNVNKWTASAHPRTAIVASTLGADGYPTLSTNLGGESLALPVRQHRRPIANRRFPRRHRPAPGRRPRLLLLQQSDELRPIQRVDQRVHPVQRRRREHGRAPRPTASSSRSTRARRYSTCPAARCNATV